MEAFFDYKTFKSYVFWSNDKAIQLQTSVRQEKHKRIAFFLFKISLYPHLVQI